MIKIEQASVIHLNELATLFNQYRVFYKKSSDIEAAKQFLKERIEAKESVILISFNEENSATGFTQLYPLFSSTRMKKLWLLNDLFVGRNYRGNGISLALIENAKDLCKKTQACGLLLETAKTNEIGNSLYPRTGFSLDEDHNYYSWDV